MQRKTLNHHKSLAALLMIIPCLLSCMDEIDSGRDVLHSGLPVSFTIGGRTITTRSLPAVADSLSASYDLEEPGLKLEEYVSAIEVEPLTKGVPVYTENLSDIYPVLGVTAYNSVSYKQWGGTDLSYDYVEESGNKYMHNYHDEGLQWPEPVASTSLRLFIRAPYYASGSSDPCTSISRDAQNCKTSFHYESPAKAVDQKDILFSTKDIAYSTKDSDANDVILFHALSGVKFKISDDCLSDGFVITKVVFAEVVDKGDCIVDTKTYTASTNSCDVVCWQLGSTPSRTAFTHEFPKDLVSAEKGDGSKFADSFYGPTAKNNLNAADFSQTFWFIPQVLDDVTVTIYYKKNGGEEQSSKVIFGSGKVWKAGELHTYTLAVKGAGVSIEDKVDGLTKKDVKITNTGNMPEYFRVAVVANWVDADGNVLASQDVSLGTLGPNWTLNAKDGYYYYTKPVNPGLQPGQVKVDDEADLLFKSYTAPARPSGADHLRMDLAVQAIDTQAKSYKEAWKEAAGVLF